MGRKREKICCPEKEEKLLNVFQKKREEIEEKLSLTIVMNKYLIKKKWSPDKEKKNENIIRYQEKQNKKKHNI